MSGTLAEILAFLTGFAAAGAVAASLALPRLGRLRDELAAARLHITAQAAARATAEQEMEALRGEAERDRIALEVDNVALRRRIDELADAILGGAR